MPQTQDDGPPLIRRAVIAPSPAHSHTDEQRRHYRDDTECPSWPLPPFRTAQELSEVAGA